MATSDASWPTEFADFKRLDATLKCGICYDYMTNCMITSCSHTYCSLCIRKFMQYKNQCPACFEETYEVHLRNNRPLDEVITIFVKMKDKLQRALRLSTIPIPIKETKSETKDDPCPTPKTPRNKAVFEPKTPSALRSSVTVVDDEDDQPDGSLTPQLLKTPGGSQASNSKTGDDVLLNGVKIPGIFNAPIAFPKVRKPDEMAQCPVCQVEVPARNINMHLDSCLAVESEVCQKKSKAPKKRDPLPKRLYHLMQDKALKKVLKEYGLNSQGDRKTLISRIQRYTVIYNAENDSPTPRPVSELILQLEREEREEKKTGPNILLKACRVQQRPTVDRKGDPDVLDKINKEYRDENRDNFKKLIEAMRAREGKNIKPTRAPPRVHSDDEDGGSNCAVAFDPNVPSTSRDDPTMSDGHSLYSQATQPFNCDSDSDIFEENNKSAGNNGLIDWDRTGVSEEETVVSESEDERSDRRSILAKSVGSNDETNVKAPVENVPCQVKLTPLNVDALSKDEPGSSNEADAEQNKTESALNNSSEKENQEDENPNSRTPGAKTPRAKSKLTSEDFESDDSIDALFEPSKTPNVLPVSPRVTRSKRSTKSGNSTPTPSTRGTKRKSNESPKTPGTCKLQETFDYLFEKYNGDRVTEDIDSDDSDSNTAPSTNPSESQEPKESETTPSSRRSTRCRRKSLPAPSDVNDTPSTADRKRAKRDLSPSF